MAEEIGISFEESLTRLTRLWALLHGLTAFLISDNVQWNNEWQLTKCNAERIRNNKRAS